jgi:hypothetical protein
MVDPYVGVYESMPMGNALFEARIKPMDKWAAGRMAMAC